MVSTEKNTTSPNEKVNEDSITEVGIPLVLNCPIDESRGRATIFQASNPPVLENLDFLKCHQCSLGAWSENCWRTACSGS